MVILFEEIHGSVHQLDLATLLGFVHATFGADAGKT
jgi:hypothetical protein